jgi:hypothetical protein
MENFEPRRTRRDTKVKTIYKRNRRDTEFAEKTNEEN